jgi:HlyD family secretion protein
MIRILLVDDQNIVRQGLQALLESKPDLKIIGTAEDGKSALEKVKNLRPDLVLIDIEMPGMNGLTATQKICQLFPLTKVIVLTSHEDAKYLAKALQAGAKGYLLKHALAEDLEKAIWSVFRGYSQIESKLLGKLIAATSTPKLITSEQTRSTLAQNSSLLAKTSSSLQKDVNKEKVLANNLTTISNNQNLLENAKKNQNGLPAQVSENTALDAESSPIQRTQQPGAEKEVILGTNRETANVNNSAIEKVSEKPSVLQKSQPKKQAFWKSPKWWIIGSLVTIACLMMGISLIRFFHHRSFQPTPASTDVYVPPPQIVTVSGLGRIEPQGKAISLSAPTSLEAAKVEQLLVQEGDRVKKGQIVATIDGRQRQLAVIEEAKTQVRVAQARLERVKAGAKQGAILARQAAIANVRAELAGQIRIQQATIIKLTAQLDNARTEFQRHQQLYDEGAISASALDSKRLTLTSAQEQLNQARASLERTQNTLDAKLEEARAALEETAEVHPIDAQIARAQLQQTQAALAKAESELELAYVRAPIDGEILAIHARPGEAIGEKGIAQIGQTDQMMVVAEIDQNDINRVKIGQRATISSGIFPENLQGRVYKIGSLIGKNDILDTDPAAKEDTRVVEVVILLDSPASKRVAKLTNLEVDVTIEL